MADIDSLYTVDAHEEGAEMQVKGPDGKLLDCYIILAGLDSKRWRNAAKEMQRKMLVDDDIADAEAIAEATLGWRGFTSKGKEIEFTKERAIQLYENAPYILRQADAFIGNRANFIKS